ncbi:MAG: MFS transporter [Phenylobacterium sp.]|nr:MFS transporter [Phenylobacterium sp.]
MTTTTGATTATDGHIHGFGSKAYRSYVLTALLVISVLNGVDRGLLSIMSEPVIGDLNLSDLQFGLLTGPAFAVVYSVMGVPIAFLSETRSRVWIMAICIGLWSLATALTGTAHAVQWGAYAISGFAMMFMFRMMVGIGEAGCTPPSTSIISDYYPPAKRSTALGFYAMHGTLGALSANLVGGPLNEALRRHFIAAEAAARGIAEPTLKMCAPANLHTLPDDVAAVCRHGASMGWRGAFILMGIVGIVAMIVFKLTVREPPRGHSDAPDRQAHARASLRDVARVLASKPSFWWMTAGATTATFSTHGIAAFQTSYVRRVLGFTQLEASLFFNVPSAITASIGVVFTGWLAERMARRHPNAIAWLPAVGLLLCVPCYLAAFSTNNSGLAIAMAATGALVKYGYAGSQYTIAQGVVGPNMRATTTAVLLLIVQIVGSGLGPLIAGGLSDLFFHLQVVDAGLGDLSRSQCRGAALAGLSPQLKALCGTADPHALRQSLLTLVSLLVIPAGCFLMALRTLQRDLNNRAPSGAG